SASDARFVSTRQQNGNPGGFELALEGEEAVGSPHGTEVVGWLAIESKSGVWSGHRYQASYTAENVGSAWYKNAFVPGFSQAPRFIAGLAGYAEDDSAHLRYQALKSASVKIMVQEDKSEDEEMNHSGEIVSYLALEGDGPLTVTMIVIPTPVPTPTPLPTVTPSPTYTPSTPTLVPTGTVTPTPTATDLTMTPIPTEALTPTGTVTPTPTPTFTPTVGLPATITIATWTPTGTATVTATATPTPY
ncbi:MAG TPA: hypothetical protein VMX56_03695, partial [Anaerolineales bacterium]|nr:hypothetical protein [Anaerolineales bacterium]